jgi:hypothetical protein
MYSTNDIRNHVIHFPTALLIRVPNSTDIYEVATPWTSDQLGGLKAAHKVDAIFVIHPEVPPQRVFRAGVNQVMAFNPSLSITLSKLSSSSSPVFISK